MADAEIRATDSLMGHLRYSERQLWDRTENENVKRVLSRLARYRYKENAEIAKREALEDRLRSEVETVRKEQADAEAGRDKEWPPESAPGVLPGPDYAIYGEVADALKAAADRLEAILEDR